MRKTKTSPCVTLMSTIIIDCVQQTVEINDVSDGYIPKYNQQEGRTFRTFHVSIIAFPDAVG